MARTITFDIPSQYKLVDLIGEGAYGTVCSAIHKPSGIKVAIKKMILLKIFTNNISDKESISKIYKELIQLNI